MVVIMNNQSPFSTKKYQGIDPAFPVFPETGGGHAAAFQGMSLRDYMAAKAMQGMLAAKGWHPDFMFPTDFNFDAGQRAADAVAVASYQYADAMLKAREQ
jgi:hypothetical protein